MGPDLHKLMSFCEVCFFNRNTIIQIGIQLFDLIEYIHFHKIIPGDIKPSNISWGIYENSSIINVNFLYLIDFVFSEYIGRTFLKEKQDKYYIKGTREFISINAHYNGPLRQMMIWKI